MSEKKPLVDELILELFPLLRECAYSFEYTPTHIAFCFRGRAGDTLSFWVEYEGAIRDKTDREDIVSLDLYRLAAMGREWAAEKGYDIYIAWEVLIKYCDKDKGIPVTEEIDWRDDESEYDTELSATFAAITAVWERVK